LERTDLSWKVFITGATGFVGHHLAEYLDDRDLLISGISFPGQPEEFGECRCKTLYHLDLRDEKGVFDILEKVKPDWIYHLAAVSNVRHSWERRRETLEINLVGTLNLFEAVRTYCPDARLLYVSSSDVYGVLSPRENAISEEEKTRAVNPYALSKISGELLGRFYEQIENLDIVFARPFPHTGPGQSSDFVCSDWAYQISQIEKGRADPVIHVGNISVQRDFIDVRDVVKAYYLLLDKGKKGEIYNISSGQAVSLEKILNILLSFSSISIKVNVDTSKLRKTDMPLLMGNNEKLKKETFWKPEIPLKQTLSDLLQYWRASDK
jgi:GDP-4-dehydro-6-deoxy-D-mannose reductase